MTGDVYSFDDELVIETPEHVELYFVLANVGNRFLASAIDHLIQVIAAAGILLLGYILQHWTASLSAALGTWALAVAILLGFSIYLGYFALFETFWSGQTLGKRWMKLRVIRDDGRPITFFEAFVRNLMRLLDFMPTSYAVGVVSIILSPNSKRIGDYVAGTVVVKERSIEAPPLEEIIRLSEAEEMALKAAPAVPLRPDLRNLTQTEMLAVETFLRRRFELPARSRETLAMRIAWPLIQKLQIDLNGMNYESFLEELNRQHKAQLKYLD